MPDRAVAPEPGQQRMAVQWLRGRKQFGDLFAHGRRFAAGEVVLIVRRGKPHVRWGIVVGKRVGKAVVRNRVKRRLREICRAADPAVCNAGDAVIVARPSAATAPYEALSRSVFAALRRARMLSSGETRGRPVRSMPREANSKAGPR